MGVGLLILEEIDSYKIDYSGLSRSYRSMA